MAHYIHHLRHRCDELEQAMGRMAQTMVLMMARERKRIDDEVETIDRQIAAVKSFPGLDASREEIEAWRAANPWPWFEALRAYTLANSKPDVREYQTLWEPEAVHDPAELPS